MLHRNWTLDLRVQVATFAILCTGIYIFHRNIPPPSTSVNFSQLIYCFFSSPNSLVFFILSLFLSTCLPFSLHAFFFVPSLFSPHQPFFFHHDFLFLSSFFPFSPCLPFLFPLPSFHLPMPSFFLQYLSLLLSSFLSLRLIIILDNIQPCLYILT